MGIQTLDQLDDLIEFFLSEVDRFYRQVFENTTPVTEERCQAADSMVGF